MGLISDGTAIFDEGAMASGFVSSMVFIKKLTASSSGTLTFVNGSSGVVLDSTYKEYMFVFQDLHPASNGVELEFQGTIADPSSSYNQTITSTLFKAGHGEDGSGDSFNYEADADQQQGDGFQDIARYVGNGNDESVCGKLSLYDPSSTAHVKHFMANTQMYHASDEAENCFTAGYFNTTAGLTRFQFKFSSGNIDAGTITLYGIK